VLLELVPDSGAAEVVPAGAPFCGFIGQYLFLRKFPLFFKTQKPIMLSIKIALERFSGN